MSAERKPNRYIPEDAWSLVLDLLGAANDLDPEMVYDPPIDGFLTYVEQDKLAPRMPFSRIDLSEDVVKRYKEQKSIGIFTVRHKPADFDLVLPSGEPLVRTGDLVVDLRIPQVTGMTGSERVTSAMVTRSLALTATYIQRDELEATYVLGLTHPDIAAVAVRRWGFDRVDRPLPPILYDLIDHAEGESYTSSENAGYLRGLALVYQGRDAFISRFLPQVSGS